MPKVKDDLNQKKAMNEIIERLKIIEGIESIGVNVGALLPVYPATNQELRDILRGLLKWEIARPPLVNPCLDVPY
jgi:hypothetical protein